MLLAQWKWWCWISIPGQWGSQVEWGREVNHHSASAGSSTWLSASFIYSCWSLAGSLSLWLAYLPGGCVIKLGVRIACWLRHSLTWQPGCLSHSWTVGWLTASTQLNVITLQLDCSSVGEGKCDNSLCVMQKLPNTITQTWRGHTCRFVCLQWHCHGYFPNHVALTVCGGRNNCIMLILSISPSASSGQNTDSFLF